MMATKAKLKLLGRKGISLLLAVVMTISLIQIGAFAALGSEADSYVSHQGEAKFYDENGKEVAESGDWAVKLLKTAEATDTPNEFEITLSVETKKRIVTTEDVVGADVVLVFDLSSSMDEGTKWSSLKTAADTFIDKMLGNGNPNQNRIAIVAYSRYYKTLLGWTDSATTAKNSYKYYGTGRDRITINSATHLNQLLELNAGTNCQAGFYAADVMLDTARSAALPYVVYMSDGEANSYYAELNCNNPRHWNDWDHGRSCYEITTDIPNADTTYADNSYTAEGADAAKQQAAVLKSNHPDSKLITVGLGIDSNQVMDPDHVKVIVHEGYWNHAVDFPHMNHSYWGCEWVPGTTENIPDGNTAVDEFHKGTTDNIDSIYSSIATQITLEATPWRVYDPMSDYVNLDTASLTGMGENVELDQEGNRIVWNLLKSTPTSSTATGSIYTYRYKVTLDQSNMNVWGKGKQNPTNATTELTYKIIKTDSQGNVTESHDAVRAPFDVPKVTAIPYTITLRYFVDGQERTNAAETITRLAGSEIDLEAYQKSWANTTFVNRTKTTPDGTELTETSYGINSTTNGTVICYNYKSGYPLTINYLEAGTGTVLADPHTDVLKAGDNYSVNSPAIPGYELVTASDATVSGAMPNRSVIINVYYQHSEHTVTYQYTGAVPTGLVAPTDSNSPYHYQDTVTVLAEPNEPHGYTFGGWTLDGSPVSSSFEMPDNDVVIYGNWVLNQYDLDVIYQFRSDSDLQVYLAAKEAAGQAAVDGIEKPVQGDGESDEEFNARLEAYETACDTARAEAEAAFEEALNAGQFTESYEAANGETYENVFVKVPVQSHDFGYPYAFTAADVPNFSVASITSTSGRLSEDTTVIFTMANNLFQLTINHYQQVKNDGGNDNVITQDGKYYILVENTTEALNGGDLYTVEEKSYTGFMGVESNQDKLVKDASMPSENVTVDLYYDAILYTADFTFVGESKPDVNEPSDQTGLWYNEYVVEPTGMTADGWSFDGWYTSEDCTGTKYDFGTCVTSDLHLFAKWSQKEYQVTYYFEGAIPSEAAAPTDDHIYHYSDTIGSNQPDTSNYDEAYDTTSRNYSFDGWYTIPGCTGDKYSFDTPITGNVKLYGKWTVETQNYPFTVEHYYEDSQIPFLTEEQPALAHGTQITAAAAANYQLGSEALAEKLKHQFGQFDSATGCTISEIVENNVVKCYYKAQPFTLTINYVYQDNKTAAPQHTETVKYDGKFTVPNPTVANYHVESVTVETPDTLELTGGLVSVSGTMPGQNVTVKVIYAENEKANVTVNYLLEGTETKIASSYTSGDFYVGNPYEISSEYTTDKTIPNYTYSSRSGDADSGTMTSGGKVINLYYTRDTYHVDVVHVDGAEGAPNQAMLTEQNTSGSYFVGEEFSHAPAANLPADYKQAGAPVITGTAEKDKTVTVTYTYLPKSAASVTVNYILVDESGEAIRTLDSQTSGYKEGDSYNVMDEITAFETANVQYTRYGEIDGATSGSLSANESKTINVYYTLNSYEFSVKYYKDSITDENELDSSELPTTGSAPFGTQLNEELVGRLLESEDWLNAARPSGYNAGSATYVTIAADAEQNVVKVLYTVQSSGGGSETNYYRVTVNYFEKETGTKIADSYVSSSIESGNSYDVTERQFDSITFDGVTYNYDSSTGDALSGSMNGNKTINLYYTAESADIPDEDTPTSDLPDDPTTPDDTGDPVDIVDGDVPLSDIPDTDVPTSDVPKTGGSMMAWVLAAAASGLGLLFLAVTGKKRKENQDAE